jgi:hypothetical protein
VASNNFLKTTGDAFTAPFKNFGKSITSDPLNTLLRYTDNGVKFPATTTVTSYALTLHGRVKGFSRPIGAVREFGVNQSLTLDQEYDVAIGNTGLPRELIPQTLNNRTIRLVRYDIYRGMFEQVFGYPFEMAMLNQQFGPITMRMTWKTPNGSPFADALRANNGSKEGQSPEEAKRAQSSTLIFEYQGCYFTTFGRTVSSENVIVMANADITWHRCVPLV